MEHYGKQLWKHAATKAGWLVNVATNAIISYCYVQYGVTVSNASWLTVEEIPSHQQLRDPRKAKLLHSITN